MVIKKTDSIISTRSKEVQLIKSKKGKYLGWSSKDGEYIWYDDPIDADTWVTHLEHLSTLSCFDTLKGMHEAKIIKVKKFIQIEELS